MSYKEISKETGIRKKVIQQFFLFCDATLIEYTMEIDNQGISYKGNDDLYPWCVFQVLLYDNLAFQLLSQLISGDSFSYDELIHQYYYSKSTLKRKLKQVETWLHPFHISLKHQGSVKVEGDRYQLEWLRAWISLISKPESNPILLGETRIYEQSEAYHLNFQLSPRGKVFLLKQIIGLEQLVLDVQNKKQLEKRLSHLEDTYPLRIIQKERCCQLLCRIYLYQKYVSIYNLNSDQPVSENCSMGWDYLSKEFSELHFLEKNNKGLARYFQCLLMNCIVME
ncbi:helix-turn-helix domain-containing protein [Enterococcus cecorum]|uniref:helix-turn-helix domain-containing protein n=1 Tax=Enterococcus cecorum TaxID=44008 RepID=UPI00200ACD45|nr:helix-turn-helix domain-containing protein [Enterococcus cecorum]